MIRASYAALIYRLRFLSLSPRGHAASWIVGIVISMVDGFRLRVRCESRAELSRPAGPYFLFLYCTTKCFLSYHSIFPIAGFIRRVLGMSQEKSRCRLDLVDLNEGELLDLPAATSAIEAASCEVPSEGKR